MRDQDSWYVINNLDAVDSPAFVVYPDRVRENVRRAVAAVPDVSLLRPHVKTNKTAEVSRILIEEGVTKFKCATIAEAEMLGMIGADDVLLAYQPVGPKVARLVARSSPAS
jgi:D-threonine aldolase